MRGGPISSGRSVRPWRGLRQFLTKRNASGYTVIEVLIVLAVTAGLFVSAAIMIGGRQNRTAFEQAVRNVQSQIQAIMDEVAIGHYPNNGNFRCTATLSGPSISAGAGAIGTNSDCIFIGKVIQFDVSGTDPEQFVVYTLAGLRKVAGGTTEAVNRVESQPKVIAPSTSQPSVPDMATVVPLESGLTTYSMSVSDGTTSQAIGAVGFMQSLAKYSGGNIITGSQNLNTVAVTGTTLNAARLATAQAINDNFPSGPYDQAGGVSICFVSGSTNQSGLVRIGGENRNQAVTLDIKSNRTCA